LTLFGMAILFGNLFQNYWEEIWSLEDAGEITQIRIA
jgi:hypothetical protein